MSSGDERSGRAASSARVGPRIVVMRREAVPASLLMVQEDASRYPIGVVQNRYQIMEAQLDIEWAKKREHLFAAMAAGFHIASFAMNMAFWNSDGMPPDRYWPESPRMRLQIRPGRYGNLEGSQRVHMDYLARVEGVMN